MAKLELWTKLEAKSSNLYDKQNRKIISISRPSLNMAVLFPLFNHIFHSHDDDDVSHRLFHSLIR